MNSATVKTDTGKKKKSSAQTAPVNSRRETREAVLKVLYAHEYTQDNIYAIIDDLCDNFTDEAMAMIRQLASACIRYEKDLDAQIRQLAKNWSFERIAVIDRLLIRMGLCELMHFEEIPVKVTISEIIAIAKRFSTSKSGSFINGILDKAAKDLQANGTIRKKGLGLIDKPPK